MKKEYAVKRQFAKRLEEVDLIRLVLIILLVVCHAFSVYWGGWPEPKGFVQFVPYAYMNMMVYSFMLESFVLISGYVFGYQLIIKHKYEQIGGGCNELIINKLKRLMLPCVFFSIIYIILYYFIFPIPIHSYRTAGQLIYLALIGAGSHLWFLPMLFWCFVFAYGLYKLKIGDIWKLAICLVFIAFHYYTAYANKIPSFQINKSFYYLFYFYSGILCYKYTDEIKKMATLKFIFIAWALYLSAFVLGKYYIHYGGEEKSLIDIYLMFLYSALGSFALLLSAIKLVRKYQLPDWLREISSMCFGVYIFQQFILMFLNYVVDIFCLTGSYITPWLTTIFTLIASLGLTYTLLQTKFGRFLIG